MLIPEIERDLKNCDPRIRYWIIYQQEQIIDLQAQLNKCADTMLNIANALAQLHAVNHGLREDILHQAERLRQKDRDGIVKSVSPHPDEGEN